MTQENKVGFFRQFFIACFQPKRYRALLERKRGRHVLYFIVLLLFMLLVDTVIPLGAWVASVGGFQNFFLNRVPTFTLENGVLDMESPMAFDLGDSILVKADSDVEAFGEDDFDSDYEDEILIGKTNLIIRAGNMFSEVSFSSLGDLSLDNEGLVGLIPYLALFIVLYLVFMFIYKSVRYLLLALIFGLLCRFAVRSPEGKFVPVGQAVLISVYAKTLFGLVNSINICAGYVIGDFVLMLISIFFAVFYTIRVETYLLRPEVS